LSLSAMDISDRVPCDPGNAMIKSPEAATSTFRAWPNPDGTITSINGFAIFLS